MLLPLLAGARQPLLAMAAAPVLCAAARHLTLPASRAARALGHLAAPAATKKTKGADAGDAGDAGDAATASQAPPSPRNRLVLLSTCHRSMATLTTNTTAPTPATATPPPPKKPTAELLREAHALAAQPPATALPALKALAADLVAAVPLLTPKQLAVLLPAVARAGFADRAFRDSACAALVPRLDELSPAELADAAFALARGLGSDHELLSSIVGRAARDPSAFGTSSLSKILWACARLSYTHDALPDLLEHVVGACCGASESAEAVAEVARAAGALDWGDDRLHAAVASYATTHTELFDGHGIAKLLSGLVAVGFDDPPLFEKLAARAAEHAVKGELAPSDAARIAWALGEGGIWSAPLLHAISEHLLEPAGRLAAFSPADLQTVVRAANKLNYCSPAVASAAAALTDRLLPCLEPLPADDDGHAPGVSSIDYPWTPMQSPPPPPSSSSPSSSSHHHP